MGAMRPRKGKMIQEDEDEKDDEED